MSPSSFGVRFPHPAPTEGRPALYRRRFSWIGDSAGAISCFPPVRPRCSSCSAAPTPHLHPFRMDSGVDSLSVDDWEQKGETDERRIRLPSCRRSSPASMASATVGHTTSRCSHRAASRRLRQRPWRLRAGGLRPPGQLRRATHETGGDGGTGGTAEQVSCHPFPRPVRRRALLRGRERRRGTTGPRLLPQRSARRAEGSWSGREETAREAPTLSCRTGRGISKDSPPQAVLDDGAAGAARSVARRVLLCPPRGRRWAATPQKH